MRSREILICVMILAGASGLLISNLHVVETGNDTLVIEWTTPDTNEEITYTVLLKQRDCDSENQTQSITSSESSKACRIEFADLKPLTEYSVTVSTSGNNSVPTLDTMTRPSLEMPEVEEVQEGSVHITLAPLPEDEAKDVEAYLLLVRPLEGAGDHPLDGIESSSFRAELDAIVRPPYYIAYEFTQEQLSQEAGGQVQVGSGGEKRDGKYGTIQDPKLKSGAFYRVVFVVIINSNGKQKMYAEESCRMLIK